jgi:prophage regulatory protein
MFELIVARCLWSSVVVILRHGAKGKAMTATATLGRKFYSYADLRQRGIPYSRVHLRRLEKAGKFPMHLILGAGDEVQAFKGWVADEVHEWEALKIAVRDGKAA